MKNLSLKLIAIIYFSLLLLFQSTTVFAISENDPSFAYTGAWNFTVQETSSNCYDTETYQDPDQVFTWESPTRLRYILNEEGKERILFAEIDNSGKAFFSYSAVESGSQVVIEVLVSINAQQTRLEGLAYSGVSDGFRTCEVYSSLKADKTISFLYLLATNDAGQPVAGIDINYNDLNSTSVWSVETDINGRGDYFFSKGQIEVVLTKDGYTITPAKQQFDMSTNHVMDIKANIVETEKSIFQTMIQ